MPSPRRSCLVSINFWCPLTDLVVERVGVELHGAGDDGLGGDGVEDVAVLEEDEPGDVGDDVAPLELLQVGDLDVGQPQVAHEVGRAHHAVGAPLLGTAAEPRANVGSRTPWYSCLAKM